MTHFSSLPLARFGRCFPKIAACIAFTAMLLTGASVLTVVTATPSEAASCGGKNEKACKISKKGPQCKKWLRKVKGKCKPCGGKDQQVCKILSKGPQCKPWTRKVKKKCRACGGKGQRACAVLAKGKVCKSGLKRKKGKCQPDRNSALRDHSKTVLDNMGPVLTNLSSLRQCLASTNRKKGLKAAIKDRDTTKAGNLVDECLSDNMRRNLRRKPQGLAIGSAARNASTDTDVDDNFFNTLSIGVGGGVIFVVGGSADAGVVIDLTRKKHVRIYTSAETAFGAGANIGADLIVGLGRDPLRRGKYKNIAVVGAGKYLAGGGVAVVFDYGDPSLDLFDGIAISGGAGAGAEVGTIHKSKSRIWGAGCKNVEITATNNSDGQVKVLDLDYYDYQKKKWYSKLTMNKRLDSEGAWIKTRRLKAVRLEETQIRIWYQKRKNSSANWGKKKRAWSSKQICENDTKFSVSLK
jgi:hypothetical protein